MMRRLSSVRLETKTIISLGDPGDQGSLQSVRGAVRVPRIAGWLLSAASGPRYGDPLEQYNRRAIWLCPLQNPDDSLNRGRESQQMARLLQIKRMVPVPIAMPSTAFSVKLRILG